MASGSVRARTAIAAHPASGQVAEGGEGTSRPPPAALRTVHLVSLEPMFDRFAISAIPFAYHLFCVPSTMPGPPAGKGERGRVLGRLQGGLSTSFGRKTIKGSFIQSSPYASCLPCVSPAGPQRAFAIISPTFQMMKSKFKEAKKPEIPQLTWQTTPSGF